MVAGSDLRLGSWALAFLHPASPIRFRALGFPRPDPALHSRASQLRIHHHEACRLALATRSQVQAIRCGRLRDGPRLSEVSDGQDLNLFSQIAKPDCYQTRERISLALTIIEAGWT